MPTIENVTLIDDIRKDALLLMKSRSIDYASAYDLARNNLIGKNKITEFKAKKLDVEIDDKLVVTRKDLDRVKNVEDSSIPYYLQVIESELKGVINPSDYNNDQIKAIVVAHQMGSTLPSFVTPSYSAEQINFIAIEEVTGGDISKYRNNSNFNVNKEVSLKYSNDINVLV